MAESIHDGPVQELIGLDMILSAAGSAAESGDTEQSLAHIKEARALATRNLVALRDEIVDLGPYAFQELTFDTAVENCIAVWNRRYDFEVLATIERIELPPEMAGDLFRIAQEAVVNAGRHSGAKAVSVSLRTVDGDVELRVTDNGDGFADDDPLASREPGHLGLASMRERAELIDGLPRHRDVVEGNAGTRQGAAATAAGLASGSVRAGEARTGMPFRCAIPASRSRSSGAEPASTFTFVPAWRLASCKPPRASLPRAQPGPLDARRVGVPHRQQVGERGTALDRLLLGQHVCLGQRAGADRAEWDRLRAVGDLVTAWTLVTHTHMIGTRVR